MGGVYNLVNLQLYHYAGNNPVKYIDPDGRYDQFSLWLYRKLEIEPMIKGMEIYSSIAKGNYRKVSSKELFFMYRSGIGRDVTLEQIGYAEEVEKAVLHSEELTKGLPGGGTVMSRFLKQIASGNEDFGRSYEFGNVCWAFGGATVTGKFEGTREKMEDGRVHIKGTISFTFFDDFSDPYDTFDVIPGKWNPDGRPFSITHEWSVSVDTVVTPDNKIKE
ncbi:hypothetical protein WKV44_10445 [Spirochaetia bacterium 38H-sp]|uniref:RHS repeat-associated core domain-containing protein n=1 Tax=Rarispira pelagica TaxID=3141764 RepID=A0ABU9UE57_9SPIR